MSEKELNGAAGGSLERAVGERKRMAGGRAAAGVAPDPELVERPVRRRFPAESKLRVLREADACTKPGEVGALLRRGGVYSSPLAGGGGGRGGGGGGGARGARRRPGAPSPPGWGRGAGAGRG